MTHSNFGTHCSTGGPLQHSNDPKHVTETSQIKDNYKQGRATRKTF